jgi:segregation and condensation protein B
VKEGYLEALVPEWCIFRGEVFEEPGKNGKSGDAESKGANRRMSLKAKLEAVIYAAEEPVTLAQLSALFAAEALEWKAEQAAERAAGSGEEPAPENEALPLGLKSDAEAETEAEAETAPEAQTGAGGVTPEGFEVGASDGEETASTDGETAAAAEEPAKTTETNEAEARKQARQREREVRGILRGLIDELIAQYRSDERGVEIREIAGGYRMATKVECHDAVRMFVKSLKPAMKLSLPALETLAVIAYKQPVTAPEVNEIRGVDSSAVFGSLLARKLIATAGRKQVIGRPILYKTTREFLLRFGLKDVAELPSMEEFEKMAALEFEESEAAGEPGAGPGPTAETRSESEPEFELNTAEDPIDVSESETKEEAETEETAVGELATIAGKETE